MQRGLQIPKHVTAATVVEVEPGEDSKYVRVHEYGLHTLLPLFML